MFQKIPTFQRHVHKEYLAGVNMGPSRVNRVQDAVTKIKNKHMKLVSQTKQVNAESKFN